MRINNKDSKVTKNNKYPDIGGKIDTHDRRRFTVAKVEGIPLLGEPKIPTKKQHSSIKSSSDETQKRIKEALRLIFPPRIFERDGNVWSQNVSTDPATTATVINLEEQLNLNLWQQRARETGICNIRRELYHQFFDELIREETVMLPERGILLSKVKDELNLTLNAYKTLYESSIAYGIRKILQAEKDTVDKEAKLEELKKINGELHECVKKLRKEHNCAERILNDECENERQMHEERLQALKTLNQKLKNQLEEAMMSMLGCQGKLENEKS